MTDELETKLRRLLNTAIRFVFGLRRDARMLPYQRTLGWLTPLSRRNYFVAVQIHRVLRQGRPAYLQDMLTRRPPMDRALRSSARDVLSVPFADRETYKRGFVVWGSRFWNDLPASLTNIQSTPAFKIALKRYLLNQLGQELAQ
uniref:Uncharacterized protein n=1 Tax=Trichogramma kaykai TaxID=54128 RepID=A0ABD2WW57_9HYME